MASIADTPFTYIGLDVHKDSISVGILEPGAEHPAHDKIFHDQASIRRLMSRFDPARLRVCYEAGPDRLRAGPPAGLDGHRLSGGCPVADPHRPGRPGQDRQA